MEIHAALCFKPSFIKHVFIDNTHGYRYPNCLDNKTPLVIHYLNKFYLNCLYTVSKQGSLYPNKGQKVVKDRKLMYRVLKAWVWRELKNLFRTTSLEAENKPFHYFGNFLSQVSLYPNKKTLKFGYRDPSVGRTNRVSCFQMDFRDKTFREKLRLHLRVGITPEQKVTFITWQLPTPSIPNNIVFTLKAA